MQRLPVVSVTSDCLRTLDKFVFAVGECAVVAEGAAAACLPLLANGHFLEEVRVVRSTSRVESRPLHGLLCWLSPRFGWQSRADASHRCAVRVRRAALSLLGEKHLSPRRVSRAEDRGRDPRRRLLTQLLDAVGEVALVSKGTRALRVPPLARLRLVKGVLLRRAREEALRRVVQRLHRRGVRRRPVRQILLVDRVVAAETLWWRRRGSLCWSRQQSTHIVPKLLRLLDQRLLRIHTRRWVRKWVAAVDAVLCEVLL
mmetsp:Transcript_18704/g.36302  ORF Transcript_18704/g.36302 Transcript_18704/m.36302 type:complete len:257 (-) Transcript_18704:126-896(-)